MASMVFTFCKKYFILNCYLQLKIYSDTTFNTTQRISMKTTLLMLLAATTISSCAKSPENILSAYISPLQYSAYSCEQLRMEIRSTSRELNQVIDAQDETASEDAIAMGIGVIVFLPALLFINGTDLEDEVARLKGEYNAIEDVAIQKECDVVVPELEKARAVVEERTAEKQEIMDRRNKEQ
jgi:hypothetical protein